jgi:hypothetical protein
MWRQPPSAVSRRQSRATSTTQVIRAGSGGAGRAGSYGAEGAIRTGQKGRFEPGQEGQIRIRAGGAGSYQGTKGKVASGHEGRFVSGHAFRRAVSSLRKSGFSRCSSPACTRTRNRRTESLTRCHSRLRAFLVVIPTTREARIRSANAASVQQIPPSTLARLVRMTGSAISGKSHS